jgi:CcmD family protein
MIWHLPFAIWHFALTMDTQMKPRKKAVWGSRRVLIAVAALVMLAVAGSAFAQQQPPDQDAYVAVTDADRVQEQLPAAPLVMAAYAIAWLAVFGYLWFLWQRLTRVEKELADVARRIHPEARR